MLFSAKDGALVECLDRNGHIAAQAESAGQFEQFLDIPAAGIRKFTDQLADQFVGNIDLELVGQGSPESDGIFTGWRLISYDGDAA